VILPAVMLLIGFFTGIQAQEVQKQEVDSLWLKQKTEQLDYTEEKLNTENLDFEMPGLPTWINSPVFKYGILFFITLILLFVLYKLFGKGLFVSDLKNESTAGYLLTEDDLDDRFYDMDLESMFKKAVSEQNWAMAIRIRFLMTLKMLIDKDQIHWHKDLTNRQIAWQIKSGENRNKFYELVGYFEKVWYGDVKVSADYFQKVAPIFDAYKVPEKQA